MLQLVSSQERRIVWPGSAVGAAASSAVPSAPVSSPAAAASTSADPAAVSAIAVCRSRSGRNCLSRRRVAGLDDEADRQADSGEDDRRCRRSEHSDAWPDEADDSGADGGSHNDRNAGRAGARSVSGLTVSLGPVTKTTSSATNCAGTHVFYGPAIQFTLTFSQPTDLSNATLNVAFGSSATPADACDAPTGSGSASTLYLRRGHPEQLAE